MNKEKITKKRVNFISVLLVIVILISELCLIPSNIQAATTALEKQNKDTNNKNVKFDSFFVNDNTNVHEIEVTEENISNINFEINVEKGYLTNGKIKVEDPNFLMQVNNNEIISNVGDNEINLKDISDTKSFAIPITMKKTDLMKKEALNKETKIILYGTYVNDAGKTSEITKEIYVKVNWKLNVELDVASNITAFIPYQDKTILQEKITFKEKERKTPIEQLKMYLTAPKINNNLPTEVRIYANSTKATNGDQFGENFTTNNYSYDNNTGNIELTVDNPENANGEIAFYDASDEYIVTYIYSQNINELLKQKLNVNTYLKTAVKLYSNDSIISKEYTNSYDITKQIGANVTTELYTTDSINKGFLYDKYNETTYNLTYKLNINNKDASETITLNTLAPAFKEDEKTYNTTKIYYKAMAVQEKTFKKFLGNDGYINIYDTNSNLIATINKDTQKNNNGELEVTYPAVQNNIRIELSKPLAEGSLELRNNKVIDASLDYDIAQLKRFTKLQEKVNIDQQYEGILNLNETYTKVDLQIDNTELMPFVDNNVNLTLNLVTNSNSYDLFKNPEIRINLPEEIESINTGEISLVYNEELKFEYARLEENGRVLVLKLTGEETNYKLGIQEGTKIIIPAVIRLKDTVSTKTSAIKLTYSNDLAKATEYSLQGKDCIEVPVNIVAKSGLITISEISGYKGEETKRTLDENPVTVQLEIEASEKTASISSTMVNNYQSDINNVRILGRIPVENNKKINGEELGSNFNTKLTGVLNANGIDGKIYYSEEAEPTEDSASWQEQVTNFENIKSFKIVLANSFGVGAKLNFSYNINIPSNLQPNLKAYATYTVKYNINGQELENTQTVGFETPSIVNNIVADGNATKAENAINMQITPKLGDVALEDNSEIHEKEVINFKVDITNNSSSSVENISIEMPIPDGLVYLERNDKPYADADGDNTVGEFIGAYTEKPDKKLVELVVDKLDVGETKTIEYELRAQELATGEETKNITTNFILKINGVEQSSKQLVNIIKKAKVETELCFVKRTYVVERNEYTYEFRINNLTAEDLTDLTTTIQIPKEVSATDPKVIYNGLGTDDENNTSIEINENNLLTFKMNTLKSGEHAQFDFLIKINELNSINESLDMFANTFIGNETYKSNISKNKMEVAEVTIEKSSPTENQEVKEGDTITYNIKVTNKSDKIYSQIYVEDTFPKEVIAETLKYNRYVNLDGKVDNFTELNEEYDLSQTMEIGDDQSFTDTSEALPKYDEEKNELRIPTILPPSAVINITITATVQKIKQTTTLTNVSTVHGEAIKSATSNEVKHYAKGEEKEPTDPDDPTNPSSEYSINGAVWLDANENGAMDSSETLLDGVEIIVVDANTSEVVKDSTGADIKATSTSTGYTLPNLPAGRYIVIFKYDKNIYKLTNYKQDGVADTLSSKAISGTATIEGNVEYVGMTDVIELTTSNINSINMGLIKLGNFDIAIEKTLSKIKTVNPKGKVQNYTYDQGTSIGKLEVAAKNLVGTKVTIEYNIKISNLGESKAYISEIVDELPADLQLDMAASNGWYEENGKIRYTNLSDLEVGQSRDIKLVATKTLTNDNLGITNNIVTIDATDSNNVQDSNMKNNTANAQLIIGTSTGRIVLNVIGMITLLAIIGIGLFIIKKYR